MPKPAATTSLRPVHTPAAKAVQPPVVAPTPVTVAQRPSQQVVQQMAYTQERTSASIPRISPDRLDQVIRSCASPELRLAAVIQLDEVKKRTVKEITTLAVVATKDPEPEIREAALWVLQRKGASGPKVAAAVQLLCVDSDASVRSRAR